MESTFWSTFVQGIKALDNSRKWRFRDDRKDLILKILGLSPGMTVLDVGCGPGSLTRKIARWLGRDSSVIGVDQDVNFVEYASKKAEAEGIENVRFLVGDALDLPLQSSSVDACISHSVIEHVPNRPFLLEQKRVCKKGGRVSVMSVRPEKSIDSAPLEIPPISEEERRLWDELWETAVGGREVNVGSYQVEPIELPRLFYDLGFFDIQVDALALPVVPDDARYSREERLAVLESRREEALERIEMLSRLVKPDFEDQIARLKKLVLDRFARRLKMARENVPVWDYQVSVVLVVSGRV